MSLMNLTKEQQNILRYKRGTPEYWKIINKDRTKCKVCGSYECECNSITLDQLMPKDKKK